MGLFLFRFWPVLVPLLCYLLWHMIVRHKAIKKGEPAPRFRDGPVYWLILSTLLTAALCFILLATGQDALKGDYIPAHLEGGTLVPSEVRKTP